MVSENFSHLFNYELSKYSFLIETRNNCYTALKFSCPELKKCVWFCKGKPRSKPCRHFKIGSICKSWCDISMFIHKLSNLDRHSDFVSCICFYFDICSL